MIKLEQLECLHSENNTHHLMITHLYQINLIPSQNYFVQGIKLQIYESDKTKNLRQKYTSYYICIKFESFRV